MLSTNVHKYTHTQEDLIGKYNLFPKVFFFYVAF